MRVPRVAAFNYKKLFSLASTSQPAMTYMAAARDQMVHALSGSKISTLRNALSATEAFTQHIISFREWAMRRVQSGKDLPMRMEYEISWQSTASQSSWMITEPLVTHELIMTLSTIAALKYNIAADMAQHFNESNRDENVVEAMKLLQEAAGIYQYIGNTIVASMDTSGMTKIPPEWTSSFHTGMMQLCLASAELLAVARGFWDNRAPQVLAKVASNASSTARLASVTFKAVKDQKGMKLNQDLVSYCYAISWLAAGLSFASLAIEAHKAEQHGLAAAMGRRAFNVIPGMPMNAINGITPAADMLKEVSSSIIAKFSTMLASNDVLRIVSEPVATAIRENENIHYQMMPAPDTLQLPPATCLAKPTTYTPPGVVFENLVIAAEQPKKFGKKGSDIKTPDVDEDLRVMDPFAAAAKKKQEEEEAAKKK